MGEVLFPSGLVLTGRGALLRGIFEAAKKEFSLPASIGQPSDLTTAIEKVNDPIFSVAVGLLKWGVQMQPLSSRKLPNFSNISGLTSRAKQWIKSLIP